VLVEAPVAEPSVEALNVSILVRLARLDDVQLNALGVRPTVERAPDELGAVSITKTAGWPRSAIPRSSTCTTR
jgi:hypothetical protein